MDKEKKDRDMGHTENVGKIAIGAAIIAAAGWTLKKGYEIGCKIKEFLSNTNVGGNGPTIGA